MKLICDCGNEVKIQNNLVTDKFIFWSNFGDESGITCNKCGKEVVNFIHKYGYLDENGNYIKD